MDNFLRCLCDQDFTALIIDGEAGEQELKEMWLILLSEYYELKGDDPTSSGHWKTSRDILRLQNHLFLLGICIDFLDNRYSDSFADSVRKLGYVFSPEIKEPDAYRSILNGIVNLSKTKFIQVQQLIKQLEKELEKVGNQKPSRQYFEGMLVAIEEMQRTPYNMEDMTVYKYIMLEKKYWHQVEILNAKK